MPKTTTAKLKKKLDDLFSIYIRKRDMDYRGFCKCITCGKEHPAFGKKQTHAGHFMKRQHLATRWDERNVNGQCISCNNYNDGEQYRHGIAIDLKFGEGTAAELDKLSKTVVKLSKIDYEEAIENIKQKIEELD